MIKKKLKNKKEWKKKSFNHLKNILYTLLLLLFRLVLSRKDEKKITNEHKFEWREWGKIESFLLKDNQSCLVVDLHKRFLFTGLFYSVELKKRMKKWFNYFFCSSLFSIATFISIHWSFHIPSRMSSRTLVSFKLIISSMILKIPQ